MGKNPQRKKGKKKKFAGRNNGPARERYWRTGRLEEHKVRALMRHNGLSRAAARALWLASRTTRRKTAAAAA